jgi:hypothetical protein
MPCNNAVIEKFNINPRKGLLKVFSDQFILRAWERVPARVVMGNDEAACVSR